jgi:hypothetical protein
MGNTIQCFVYEKNLYQIEGTARLFWEENEKVYEGWLDIVKNKIIEVRINPNVKIRDKHILINDVEQTTICLYQKLRESIIEKKELEDLALKFKAFTQNNFETLNRNFKFNVVWIDKLIRKHEKDIKFLTSMSL